jgi:hypothetical protein
LIDRGQKLKMPFTVWGLGFQGKSGSKDDTSDGLTYALIDGVLRFYGFTNALMRVLWDSISGLAEVRWAGLIAPFS